MAATDDSGADALAASDGQTRAKLTEGSMRGHLVSLTVPMIWGILSIFAFQIADTWFVAQLGTDPLAAISFTFPVVTVFAFLALGLGIGTSSVVARAIGEGNEDRVRRLTTDALLLSLLIVAAFIALGLATVEPLFTLMGAPPRLLPLISDYMVIWYLGMIFLVVPMVGNSAIRATGDAKFPSYVMMIASGLNVILDPILIFGWFGVPRLEMEGAALATVISRAGTLIAALAVLHFREHLIVYTWPSLARLRRSWRQILHVGLPAAATNTINPIAIGVITKLMAGFGTEAVAAFGIATRVETVGLVVLLALSGSINPLVGQNWGAGRFGRVRKALSLSYRFCLLYGLAVAALLALGADAIPRLFDDNQDVVAIASVYLWLVPVSYGAYGVLIVASAGFNGIGRPLPPTLLALLRMAAIYIPLAWLLSPGFGPTGIIIAASLSNLAAGVAAWLWCRAGTRRIDAAA
ncbi:MAG: MATE family efflux transporter [Alphaproteobacteria bacterium]|nr:MATE family efflux transporter [Alphaproteobacteria bacterium]